MGATAVSRKLTMVTCALALVAVGCTNAKPHMEARAFAATTSTEAPTTTTEPAPTTTRSIVPLPGFGYGARGAEVQALEEKLAATHYDVGKVDGYFDGMTMNAVIAFQKVEGLKRSGRATDDVVAKLATTTVPPSMVPGGGARRVEVDILRQVLFLYIDNALYRILPVSTGNEKRYCVDGDCAYAVTPGGSFRVTWRVKGWHESRLGKLYNPLFFNGGIAIHGSTSVPTYPASHGCVRIPLAAAEWFPSVVPRDTPVYVLNGKIAPVPFDEPAPDGTPPSSVPTTTTTSTTQPSTFPFPNNTTSTTQPPPYGGTTTTR